MTLKHTFKAHLKVISKKHVQYLCNQVPYHYFGMSCLDNGIFISGVG